jgi:hypothetical protein
MILEKTLKVQNKWLADDLLRLGLLYDGTTAYNSGHKTAWLMFFTDEQNNCYSFQIRADKKLEYLATGKSFTNKKYANMKPLFPEEIREPDIQIKILVYKDGRLMENDKYELPKT